jgi:hypothetical protein
MDGKTIERLHEKNQQIIDMVIERAKRDFPDDIALIGLTGSFATGDFHEKSDLDLIIVNQTDRGWGMSSCFIFDGVGYDIYCTPWDNLERKAALDCVGVSSLTDLVLFYHAKPEYLERFNRLREQALTLLAEPVGEQSVKRAEKHISQAKQAYADMMLAEDIGAARYASGGVLLHTVNALVSLNNTCIKRGVKRYLEELLAYTYLPDNFEALYTGVIEAKNHGDIQEASFSLLRGVTRLYDAMRGRFTPKPVPTFDNLNGTYEELWCNCRNKILASAAANDPSYAFFAAMGAQNYLDEMETEKGTPHYDLMRHFDAGRLDTFKSAFLEAMDDYRMEYDKVNRKVLTFETFNDLYSHYMKK